LFDKPIINGLTFLNLEFSSIYTNFKTKNSSNHYDIHLIEEDSNIKIGYIPTPMTQIINKNDFYISINEIIPIFNLFRIKINFKGLYSKNNDNVNKIYSKDISGELIDVSISKENKSFTYGKDIVKYKLNKLDNIKLEFFSYSLEYFIKELTFIIFKNENSSKIQKRINRLLLLSFIQANIIDDKKISEDLKIIINLIIDYLRNNSIENENIILNSKYSGFIDFYKNLKLIYTFYNDDKKKIKEFKDFSLKILLEINELKENRNNFDLYNITKLGGDNYMYKYLKYKKKYLELKYKTDE